jgi:cystathionine gamma-lyase
MSSKSSHLATKCIHAGDTVDPATGAVMPPIVTSTTFEHAAFKETRGYAYSRTSNPTRAALERCVAELEGGTHGFAYASGMAAAAGVLELLPPGSHVIAPRGIYGGTLRLLQQVRQHSQGLECSFIDFNDAEALENTFKSNTRLLWLETPTNPLLEIVDLEKAAVAAHAHDVLVCVDNTFATPILQRPLEFGCDIVMHSTTKYLGGHSDVIGGLNVVADKALAEQMRSINIAIGAIAGPFDAYMVLRGVKTLELRMQRHEENAAVLAAWLEQHPLASKVIYPGLSSHPQHELAARQMDGFGGVLSFVLDGDIDAVRAFMEGLKVFTMAESLGGVESLAGHPMTMSHSNIGADQRNELGIVDSMIRLSPGIEHVDDLVADLEQALACCG